MLFNDEYMSHNWGVRRCGGMSPLILIVVTWWGSDYLDESAALPPRLGGPRSLWENDDEDKNSDLLGVDPWVSSYGTDLDIYCTKSSLNYMKFFVFKYDN